MFWNILSCFGTSFSCFGTSFSCLERLFPVLERPFPGFLFFWEGYFVPGRDGTEEFVPGHLLLPLSRDKGTPGQEFFFVPGQRDNGTSRPVETLVCMYLNFNGFIEWVRLSWFIWWMTRCIVLGWNPRNQALLARPRQSCKRRKRLTPGCFCALFLAELWCYIPQRVG